MSLPHHLRLTLCHYIPFVNLCFVYQSLLVDLFSISLHILPSLTLSNYAFQKCIFYFLCCTRFTDGEERRKCHTAFTSAWFPVTLSLYLSACVSLSLSLSDYQTLDTPDSFFILFHFFLHSLYLSISISLYLSLCIPAFNLSIFVFSFFSSFPPPLDVSLYISVSVSLSLIFSSSLISASARLFMFVSLYFFLLSTLSLSAYPLSYFLCLPFTVSYFL